MQAVEANSILKENKRLKESVKFLTRKNYSLTVALQRFIVNRGCASCPYRTPCCMAFIAGSACIKKHIEE